MSKEKLPIEVQEIIKYYSDKNRSPVENNTNGVAYSFRIYYEMLIELNQYLEHEFSPFALGLSGFYAGTVELTAEADRLHNIRTKNQQDV